MKWHTFAMKVNDGKMNEFRRGLGLVRSELMSFLDIHKIRNFSIWNVEHIVFGYYETDDNFFFLDSDKEQIAVWERAYGNLYKWISTPFEEMRLMYHDFGIGENARNSSDTVYLSRN